MQNTIQVHPHDVRDEGAKAVLKNVVERASIPTIIAETGTLEERHPYPSGQLEHNPVQSVVYTDACFEIPESEGWFSELPFRPRLSQQARAAQDYIQDLRDLAPQYGAEILPWIKALNAAFEGDVEQACVVTFSGEQIPTWLCPNNPLTETYVRSLILTMLERYPSRAILVDRLRYPDWSGATVSVKRMLTCFCPHCIARMESAGMNTRFLRQLLESLSQEPLQLVSWLHQEGKEAEVLRAWFNFRMQSINRLASKIWLDIKAWRQERGVEVDYWLNLWPPSFAPLLGQNYKSLGKYCEGAKHFPYHKLGGGADLAAFVKALAGHTAIKQEEVFRELSILLGLDLLTFEEYQKAGLPVSFVAEQTRQGKDAFGGNKIFTGIQIWDIPEEEIKTTIEAALDGGADGLFFYCYGWASLSALDHVGEYLRTLK